MIHAIFQELKEKQKAITVDTVERFQGSERKNMILTLPIHDNSSLSSLMSLSPDGSVDRKLNVALSRAQERLLILGNREMCLGSQHFAFLLDKIQAAGNIIPAKQIMPE
jgi:DNA replication ATP-dependent helicase Dna2